MKRGLWALCGFLGVLPARAGWHHVVHRHVVPAPVVVVQPPPPVQVDPKAFAAYLEISRRLQAEAQARRDAQIRAIVAAENSRPKEDPKVVEARVVKFLQERVEQGSLDARYDLAERHLQGQGVTQDQARAMRLLQEASVEGHEPSKRLLKQLSQSPSEN